MENNISGIQWVEKEIRLDLLKPFERNPRRITDEQFIKLKASLIRLGQFRPLLVTHDFRLAGGHQRIKAMKELGYETCRVSVPDRKLTDGEYKQLILQDNHENGTWDYDLLSAEFDLEDLRLVGLHDVMNMPPVDKLEEQSEDIGKGSKYCCPECGHIFKGKGNKVDG